MHDHTELSHAIVLCIYYVPFYTQDSDIGFVPSSGQFAPPCDSEAKYTWRLEYYIYRQFVTPDNMDPKTLLNVIEDMLTPSMGKVMCNNPLRKRERERERKPGLQQPCY